jgi:hypothetical protein
MDRIAGGENREEKGEPNALDEIVKEQILESS